MYALVFGQYHVKEHIMNNTNRTNDGKGVSDEC